MSLNDDAKEFLRRVPGGDAVVRQLASLLNLKDEAHYGFHNVSTPELKQALRRARALTEFSAGVLGRPAAR